MLLGSCPGASSVQASRYYPVLHRRRGSTPPFFRAPRLVVGMWWGPSGRPFTSYSTGQQTGEAHEQCVITPPSGGRRPIAIRDTAMASSRLTIRLVQRLNHLTNAKRWNLISIVQASEDPNLSSGTTNEFKIVAQVAQCGVERCRQRFDGGSQRSVAFAASVHDRCQPGSDITAARNGREVVEFAEKLFLRQCLQRARQNAAPRIPLPDRQSAALGAARSSARFSCSHWRERNAGLPALPWSRMIAANSSSKASFCEKTASPGLPRWLCDMGRSPDDGAVGACQNHHPSANEGAGPALDGRGGSYTKCSHPVCQSRSDKMPKDKPRVALKSRR